MPAIDCILKIQKFNFFQKFNFSFVKTGELGADCLLDECLSDAKLAARNVVHYGCTQLNPLQFKLFLKFKSLD